MQPKIEKELIKARESGERSKEELAELLTEEHEIAEGSRDRLSTIADLLRQQYTDNKSGQLSVVKETFHVEGKDDVVQYRAPTEKEAREERIKRGETTLKDAFLNNDFIKGITEAGKASSWVRDEDQGITATLIRSLLGDRKSPTVQKETEYIRGRSEIERELHTETTKEQTKEIVGAIDNLRDTIKVEPPTDLLTAQEKEEKAEELNLFQKQNKLLQGILENTKRLIKGTNGLQAVKDTMNSGNLLDNVFDLYALKKGGDLLKRIPDKIKHKVPTTVPKPGDVIQKSKTKGSVLKRAGEVIKSGTQTVLTKGGEVLAKGGEVLAKQGKTTIATVFDKGRTIAEKAVTSNASQNVVNSLKSGTQTVLTKGGEVLAKGGEVLAKGGATKIPIVGGLIAGGVNAFSYNQTANELDEKVKRGEITKTEAENQKVEAKGSAIGSTLGTVTGTALGALGGPIGMAIGATVGEFLGDKIGGFIGGWFKEEKPKVEKEIEKKPPEKEKTVHEKWVEHQENLRTGREVVRIGNRYKLKDSTVTDTAYRKMVDEEWKNLRKLDRYKDKSRTELMDMAKENVYNGNTLSSKYRTMKSQTAKIAGIDENALDEYNKQAEIQHDFDMSTVAGLYAIEGESLPEYKPITKEDIQNAREQLKVLESDKGLEIAEQNREKPVADSSTRLYQTMDKQGNVIGATLIKGGQTIQTVDNTNGLVENQVKHHAKLGLFDTTEYLNNTKDVGVKERADGFRMNATGENQRQNEMEKQKEVKVEVNNTNVQNVNQNNRESPMYSQNTSPSYQRVFGGNEV